MISETSFPVRYAETDQMGIVHHAVYAVWFECGRTRHIEAFGLTYAGLEEEGALLPLLKLTCQYHRPMRYGEIAHVRTRLVKAGLTRVLFGYTVHEDSDGPICASGTTEHAWTDKSLKPLNLRKSHPELFSKMAAMYQNATGD